MKTQTLLRRNAPISSIGLLLLLTTTLIGCGVLFNVNRVMRLDPVILTEDDLPMMQLTWSNRKRSLPKESSAIVGFQQSWSGDLDVKYWLFDASYTAIKAAETGEHHISAAPMNWQPERNPEDLIGDGTWRHIPRGQNEWEYRSTHIVFVKNNVLVHIMTGEFSSNQLQFALDVARKIETKIEKVLNKK